MISPFLFLVSPHFLLKRDTRVIMSKSKSNASSLFKTLHGVSHLLSVKARVLKRPSKAHCDLLLSHGLFDFTFCSPHASCLCSTTLLSLWFLKQHVLTWGHLCCAWVLFLIATRLTPTLPFDLPSSAPFSVRPPLASIASPASHTEIP